MKIVFLDIDGVFNTRTSCGLFADKKILEAISNRNSVSIRGFDLDFFISCLDPNLIKNLKFFKDCSFVLSSSWRSAFSSKYDLETLSIIFRLKGAPSFFSFYDCTPISFSHRPRHLDIELFLEDLEDSKIDVENYIIIDDMPDANIPGHFIITHEDIGFVEDYAKMALKIL